MGRLLEILSILFRNRVWKNLSPEKLCYTLESLGPVYTKIGQIVSVSSGILPEEYCRALSGLRTDATAMSEVQLKYILERELGVSTEKLFSEFDFNCVGAASVAQVHYARLHSGEAVAVKIQRPGLLEMLEKDIALFRKLSKLINLTPAKKVVDPNAVLDEFLNAARMELDFTKEAENLERFRELSGQDTSVTCPKVYPEYSTKHVLCMEYIDGIRIDDKAGLIEAGHDTEALLGKLLSNYARQLLETRFFHADPHPGNIIIRDDQIVWIDLGLVGYINEKNSLLLKKGIMGVVEFSANKVADVLIEMGTGSEPKNREQLVRAIEEFMDAFRQLSLEELDIMHFLNMFLEAAGSNGIVMPEGVTMLTRSVAVIKSIVDTLKPDADILYLLGTVLPSLNFEMLEEL